MKGIFLLPLAMLFAVSAQAASTDWMRPAKYGLFMHYQYRIMLGYGGSGPFTGEPDPRVLNINQFNGFVNGFDVNGFANQMQAGGVGWVIFGVDDALFGYCASPNATLDSTTGLAHKHTSDRDLILELAQALHARNIKLIVYYAGLFDWTWDPTVWVPLGSDGSVVDPQSPASRQLRLNILAEYANRWGANVDGWFLDEYHAKDFDDHNPLGAHPDLWDINAVLRSPNANPNAMITFSSTPEGNVAPGIEDYAAGDTYTHLNLTDNTPNTLPGDPSQQWHLKMYCGDIYHGLGYANYYADSDLINWINTVNSEGGVVTMDWPYLPQTGLLKDFGIGQLERIAQAVKGIQLPPHLPPPPTNWARGILPTASVPPSTSDGTGTLATITNGDLNSANYVRLSGAGPQWVEIDLGAAQTINDLRFWHYYADARSYHGVIAQLSNSADFSSGVTTVFNNDSANAAGQGAGNFSEYPESAEGEEIPVPNLNARYVRLWTNGSSESANNHYVEVEVLGTGGATQPRLPVAGGPF